MKNKRGITLIELIISIALISIVIVFLFQLLVDVKNSDNKIDYAKEFQQQRAVIIKNIQEDFLNNKLVNMRDHSVFSAEGTKIAFAFSNSKSSELSVTKDTIEYKNIAGVKEVWKLKDNRSFDCLLPYNVIGYNEEHLDQKNYSISITIPLQIKSKNENVMDDLQIFYLGKKEDLMINDSTKKPYILTSTSYLGKACS